MEAPGGQPERMVRSNTPPTTVVRIPRTARLVRRLRDAATILTRMREFIPPTVLLQARGLLIGEFSGGGAGVCLSFGQGLAIYRLPGNEWSLPVPFTAVSMSAGLCAGGINLNYVAVVTDDNFIDVFSGNKIVVQKGFATHGEPKYAPVRFRRLDWGVIYIYRNGFFSGASYSKVEFRVAPAYLLYSQNHTPRDLLLGNVTLDGDLMQYELYSLLCAMDNDGMDPAYQ